MKCARNSASDFTLDIKNIPGRQFPIVGVRPNMTFGRRIDELDVNSQSITSSLYLTLKYSGDSQQCTDIRY